MSKKTLGIIGGVGPLATMFIGEMIVRRTEAERRSRPCEYGHYK